MLMKMKRKTLSTKVTNEEKHKKGKIDDDKHWMEDLKSKQPHLL